MPTTEPIEYKNADHAIRAVDSYAMSKYWITARWLKQFSKSSTGSPGTLLNIGCGGGEFNLVAAGMGFNVIGAEPEENAYQMALQNSNTFPKIRIEKKSILDLSPAEHQADVIVLHDVLEHIKDDTQAIEHLIKILKPQGLLLLSVPALPWLYGYHDRQMGHFRRYSKTMILQLCRGRFSVKRIRYFGMLYIPLLFGFSRLRLIPVQGPQIFTNRFFSPLLKLLSIFERLPMPIGTSLLAELQPLSREKSS